LPRWRPRGRHLKLRSAGLDSAFHYKNKFAENKVSVANGIRKWRRNRGREGYRRTRGPAQNLLSEHDGQSRTGRRSGSTSISTLRATPGCRRMKPPRSRVSTIWWTVRGANDVLRRPNDVALLLHTSGTTSQPGGLEQAVATRRATDRDCQFAQPPLSTCDLGAKQILIPTVLRIAR
jgi:hypothetical protein